MSTRANIAIGTCTEDLIWAYKHHDGFPGDVVPEIGAVWRELYKPEENRPGRLELASTIRAQEGYEETDDIHGDIDYLYLCLLVNQPTSGVQLIIQVLEPTDKFGESPGLNTMKRAVTSFLQSDLKHNCFVYQPVPEDKRLRSLSARVAGRNRSGKGAMRK